jgi:hypothetical protein
MKTFKFLVLLTLLGGLGITTLSAQNTRWRIANGPGAGAVLYGFGSNISSNLNLGTMAFGFIAPAHLPYCDCAHYHGFLYGKQDNDEGCGWGCVVQIPVNIAQARSQLTNAIAQNTGTNTALRSKLNMLVMKGTEAISNDCSSLFRGVVDAMGEELLGAYFNGQLTDGQIDGLIGAIADFTCVGLEDMALPLPPPPPPPKPCKVQLMLRRGSPGQTKLFDAKRKVYADVGEVVVLDAQGCPEGGSYEWDYKFMGAAPNAVPSRTGISFTPQRFCLIAEKATTVSVTVTYHCPDGKAVKDTVTISYQ